MADQPTILILVQRRLPTTHELPTIKNEDIESFIDEVMVYEGGDFVDEQGNPRNEEELTLLQKGYIADLTAAKVLMVQLNRYMEDAKVKTGGDGVTINEYPDKLKYIQAMIKGFEDDAARKAGRLGTAAGYVPAMVNKVTAMDESDESDG
jgi:hypothetical protein